MKYVLMFCGRTPQEAARWEATSEEARAQRDARVGQWFAQYRSKIGGAVRVSDNRSHRAQPPLIVRTTFPVFCSVSTYLDASTTSSSG